MTCGICLPASLVQKLRTILLLIDRLIDMNNRFHFILSPVVVLLFLFFGGFFFAQSKLLSPVHASPITDTIASLVATHNSYALEIKTTTLPTPSLTNDSAYIAVDYDSGQVILSNNVTSRLPIASLTKIMSAMVALDLATPEEQITISRNAASQIPTKIGVTPGEKMTLDELLHAMLMTSANDAAQAVADGINAKYNANIFVWAMNKKAQDLGLTDTHFENAKGFDAAGNYSSAKDLATLSEYALSHYPEIAHIVALDYIHLPANSYHKQYDLYNWNGLLDVYPNVSGIKIGNTEQAKYTNVVVSERNGKKILVVVLGADGVLQRDLDAATVLDSAFQLAYQLQPVNISVSDLEAKYSTWHYWN
jgi:D-alanyl-D-alanine carboxypeptidase